MSAVPDTHCSRCGQPLRLGTKKKSKAPILRLAHKPKGVCADCAVTEHLMNIYPINSQLYRMTPEKRALSLGHPQIQDLYYGIIKTGGADMQPEEIDWDRVVANWDLPVEVKRTATNPWMPDDEIGRPPEDDLIGG